MEPRDARRWIGLATGVVAVGCIGLLLAHWIGAFDKTARVEPVSDRGRVTHEYLIPAGTAAHIASGEPVDIVPERLHVTVGDTIRIRNDDRQAASVGIFYVGAHQSITMRFTEPGQLEGTCDIHPSGRFTIEVDG